MTRPDRRIVVFAPHFAEYASRLAEALSARAHVLLVTEARNRAAECADLEIAAPSERLGRLDYRADVALQSFAPWGLAERRRVRRAIERFAPDLVHVQEQGDAFTAALVARLAARRPIVLTVHDPVPHSGSDSAVAKMFEVGLRRLRAVASAYHVHGDHCAGLLRSRLSNRQLISSTAHGVILCDTNEPCSALGDSFLFFGRMEAYKGIDTLLDAIDRLPSGHGLRFVFAGRGPELDLYRARIAAQPCITLEERFLSPREAMARFQKARAVLVPYRDATQSGVIAAAIGNGRPVIASHVGGLVDAVRDGSSGLLVPPDDPPALAEAISRLADRAFAERLADGARREAAGRFAWPVIADTLVDLYETVLA